MTRGALKQMIRNGQAASMPTVTDKKLRADLIFYAISKGDPSAIQLFHQRGWDLNENSNYYDSTIIEAVNRAKNLDVLKALIGCGADLDAPAHDESTALMVACERGRPDIVRLLVESGAGVNHQDRWGNTAIMRTITPGGRGSKKRILECVQTLLDHNADINLTDMEGETAVFMAMKEYNDWFFDFLAKSGANIELPNKNGSNLLQYAAIRNDLDACMKLVSLGANVNARNGVGYTALHFAVLQKINYGILEFLVSKGADVSIKDNFGETYMDIIQSRHYEKLSEKEKSDLEHLYLSGYSNSKNEEPELLMF